MKILCTLWKFNSFFIVSGLFACDIRCSQLYNIHICSFMYFSLNVNVNEIITWRYSEFCVLGTSFHWYSRYHYNSEVWLTYVSIKRLEIHFWNKTHFEFILFRTKHIKTYAGAQVQVKFYDSGILKLWISNKVWNSTEMKKKEEAKRSINKFSNGESSFFSPFGFRRKGV